MNKKIALVLSSGGARGVAHIGVIEGLLDRGFEITAVAGSSMGAVVGAFYACGKLEEYKKWICTLDRLEVFKLIDFTLSGQGFIKGERVFKSLKEFIPDCAIEEMKIPFVAVATDLTTHQEVAFDKGSMYHAIRASIAIPTVLKPLQNGESILVDGGVINPVPANLVKMSKGVGLVVSNVNAFIPYERPAFLLSKKETGLYAKKISEFKKQLAGQLAKFMPGPKPVNKKLGYFDLLNDSLDLLQDRLSKELLKQYSTELTVNVSRDACTTFEFYRAKELIEAGRMAFEKAYCQKEREKSIAK